MKVLSSLDLAKNQLIQAVIEVLASAPTSPVEGQIYYNSTNKTIYVRTDSVWLDLGLNTSDTLGPDGDKGDITVGGSGTTLTIDPNSVTYAKLQKIVTANTLLGSLSANGTVTELTKAQVLSLLNVADGAQVNVGTNIAQGTRTTTTVPITSSTGTGATLAVATTSLAGVMSSADKTKLDGIATGAQVNVATNLAQGTKTATTVLVTSSTGTSATLTEANTTQAGLLGAAKWNEIVANTAKVSYPGSSILTPYQLKSEKDAVNGYAGLDASGKLNPSQLPALAITDTFVVATEVAMLALTAEVGDVAIRTDLNKSFILKTTGASTLGNWQELLTPTAAVQSVFGRSGTVTAQSGDYTADQITETATKVFVTPSEKTAITHSNRAALDLVLGTNTGNEVQATETVLGIAEIATQTETNTGTDDLRIVTPLKLSTRLTAAISATKYAANIGNGASTSFTITNATHALGTSGDFIVQVREVATGDLIITDVNINSSTGAVIISFNVAPTTNQYRVVIKS